MAALEIFQDNPRLEAIRQSLIKDPNVVVGASRGVWNTFWSTGDSIPFGLPSMAKEKDFTLKVAPHNTLLTTEELNAFCQDILMPYFRELKLRRFEQSRLGTEDWNLDLLICPNLEFIDTIAEVAIKPKIVAKNPEALALRPKFSSLIPNHSYSAIDVLQVYILPDGELLKFMEEGVAFREVQSRFPWLSNTDDLAVLYRTKVVKSQLFSDLQAKSLFPKQF